MWMHYVIQNFFYGTAAKIWVASDEGVVCSRHSVLFLFENDTSVYAEQEISYREKAKKIISHEIHIQKLNCIRKHNLLHREVWQIDMGLCREENLAYLVAFYSRIRTWVRICRENLAYLVAFYSRIHSCFYGNDRKIWLLENLRRNNIGRHEFLTHRISYNIHVQSFVKINLIARFWCVCVDWSQTIIIMERYVPNWDGPFTYITIQNIA
jgi:hypothetical protein